MLSYPSAITLSTRTHQHLTDLLRQQWNTRRCRWRRLNANDQALLVLAHLRNGDTFARLAAGFGIGTATAWRYVQEALTLLAASADDLATVIQRMRRLVFVILDGTLIPIDRVRNEAAYYSGKHRRHGMNIQVITDPLGRLIWASPALPGRTHDLTAARTHAILTALADADILAFADKAYQGGDPLCTPHRRHRYQAALSDAQQLFNHSHTRIRAHGERANAVLKTWRILTKLRCCPRKATTIVQALTVLQHTEDQH